MGTKYYRFFSKNSFLRDNSGMTLAEILVVTAIFALLVTLAALSLKPGLQLAKARDGRRIADLKRISTGLEDYAGDEPCYPQTIYVSQDICKATDAFGYYLKNIPCDPLTHKPYEYQQAGCKNYYIYTNLEAKKETTYGRYNYAIASSNVQIIPTVQPIVSPAAMEPEPTVFVPDPDTIYYGCENGGCVQIFPRDGKYCSGLYGRKDYCLGDECCYFQCKNPGTDCVW